MKASRLHIRNARRDLLGLEPYLSMDGYLEELHTEAMRGSSADTGFELFIGAYRLIREGDIDLHDDAFEVRLLDTLPVKWSVTEELMNMDTYSYPYDKDYAPAPFPVPALDVDCRTTKVDGLGRSRTVGISVRLVGRPEYMSSEDYSITWLARRQSPSPIRIYSALLHDTTADIPVGYIGMPGGKRCIDLAQENVEVCLPNDPLFTIML